MKNTTFGRNLAIGAIISLLAAFFVVSNVSSEVDPWICGYVTCWDGTPIENASVKVTYCSNGNDCDHPEIQTYTNDLGYYKFSPGDFECKPDYGVIKVTKQFGQTKIKVFNYVPIRMDFHFFCGEWNFEAAAVQSSVAGQTQQHSFGSP